jgi:hypothetical protein
VLVKDLQAQDKSFTQYLYWLRYQNQLTFSKSIYWVNEIDNRRFFDPDVANQFITHSRLHLKKDRWDFAGGLTYSVAFASKPENGYKHSVSELRPVLEANYEFPVGILLVQARVRFDNRFFESDQDKSIFEESQYVFRHRYRLQGRVPIKKNDEGINTVILKSGYEIMFNSKKNTFDQSRIFVSGEFLLNKHFSFESGYIYIHQQRFGLDEFFDRHVLRASLMHRIGLQ